MEFQESYAKLFSGHMSSSSNFLVVLDEAPHLAEQNFDLILSFPSGEARIQYRQTFSENFIRDLESFLRGNASNLQPHSSIIQPEAMVPAPSIHERFMAIVQAKAGQVAVRHDRQVLTFSELNDQANLLASRLVAQPDFESSTFIGIQLPRGIDAVVGVLGILKTGKAFVPIDVHWPENRVDRIRKKAHLNLILDQELFPFIMNEEADVKDFSAAYRNPEEPAYALFTRGRQAFRRACLFQIAPLEIT